MFEQTAGRGYHLWAFFERETPSEWVWGLAHELVEGLEGAEAFPKQKFLIDGYGNFVRIPLGRRGEDRSVLLYPDSLFDVRPCRLWEHVDVEKWCVEPPWSIFQARCPYKVPYEKLDPDIRRLVGRSWVTDYIESFTGVKVEHVPDYACNYRPWGIPPRDIPACGEATCELLLLYYDPKTRRTRPDRRWWHPYRPFIGEWEPDDA